MYWKDRPADRKKRRERRKREKERARERGRERILYPLIHFLDTSSSFIWIKVMPGVTNSDDMNAGTHLLVISAGKKLDSS